MDLIISTFSDIPDRKRLKRKEQMNQFTLESRLKHWSVGMGVLKGGGGNIQERWPVNDDEVWLKPGGCDGEAGPESFHPI
ncbi:hypothetical protein PGTUg99_001209 [Puccinia graminis f. sp. tritici]|uniref:Uncharacterized protein n=1 Tax=Puccinia graminis f. sp. tritici TaxID=56615 RepID=A0A5B0QKY9_PUCGR|nr:hypothetical protein PGTUg99_001209 [Puccinia graminis f. sp. tritici]